MITRDDLIRIASRYDTIMSRAMLRALGACLPAGPRRGTVAVRADRYDGADRLMAQRFGVRL